MFDFLVDKHLFLIYNAITEQMFRTYERNRESKGYEGMKVQKELREMNDRELRSYRRALRLRRERRRKAAVLAISGFAAFCIIMVFSLSYGALRSNASSGFKYYTSITVEAGENLWDIADEYIDYYVYRDKNSYISEVRSINHLDENGTIAAGQILVVPYYSTEFVY